MLLLTHIGFPTLWMYSLGLYHLLERKALLFFTLVTDMVFALLSICSKEELDGDDGVMEDGKSF
jgi:magnesium-transporting ATPase (P-type)